MKKTFVDKDLEGCKIDQRAKDSKSVEVDGDNRFCGHRFLLKKKLYGDKRCLYCGKWFHWDSKRREDWIRTGNVDRLNLDTNIEPLHCGSLHCEEYHRLCQVAVVKRAEEMIDREQHYLSMFKKMKTQRIIV